MTLLQTPLWLYLLTYLVSGIPFGYLLAKRFADVDIKKEGSGNIGATNVLRVVKAKDPLLAKKLGATTLFLDAIKGALFILLAKALGFGETVQWTIAVLAVLGHCFSPFLKFEGGKGVATGFGVLLTLLPLASLIALIVWGIVAKGLKISSLSSLAALLTLIVAGFMLYPKAPHAPLLIIAFIVFYKHIPNLKRLLSKEEKAVV